MPEQDPAEYVRVTDRDTGHKLTIRRAGLGHGNFTELKADAIGPDDQPLPPEFNAVEPAGRKATANTQEN